LLYAISSLIENWGSLAKSELTPKTDCPVVVDLTPVATLLMFSIFSND